LVEADGGLAAAQRSLYLAWRKAIGSSDYAESFEFRGVLCVCVLRDSTPASAMQRPVMSS
jgi:hypothetical protein